MSNPESYVDRCVAAAGSINAEQLSQYALGSSIGRRGGNFTMRTLGEVSVLGLPVHCGVKVPKRAGEVGMRMSEELEAIELLLSGMPELASQVPQFMAMVAIDGGKPAAQLTEDVSRGGELDVRERNFNEQLADSVMTAFAEVDYVDIDEDVIETSLSFWAGDESKLLDFTPRPITDVRIESPLCERIDRLVFSERTLVVDVSAESPLGRSLAELISA